MQTIPRCRCCDLPIPRPTKTLPGTVERAAVMVVRAVAGECLWNPRDRKLSAREVLFIKSDRRNNILSHNGVGEQRYDGVEVLSGILFGALNGERLEAVRKKWAPSDDDEADETDEG